MKIFIFSIFKNKIHFASMLLGISLLLLTCQGKREMNNKVILTVPGKAVTLATGFTITKKDHYSIVTITNPWQGAVDVSMVHYLVNKGSALPEGIDSSHVIFVPVSSIICMSTTHVGMILALGEENSIKALSGAGFVYSDAIAGKVTEGFIEEVGYESNLNHELIIRISPELVMMYGIGSESAGHVNKLRELGINIIFNADYLETEPLGKAEWIKLFGALYCKEALADSIFQGEVRDYNEIKNYVLENTSEKPNVLLGLPFKETWYVSPGNSFISKLISDAGGNYLWQNTTSAVSMPYGLENVYITAINADYWLNIGTVTTSEEISLVDKRLSDLESFKTKHLFNNNKRVRIEGGNDYWESGALKPHIILKDIASILHPTLFTDYELFYYRKID